MSVLFVGLLCLSGTSAIPWTTVILDDAVKQGAMCLDGSPPGYHIQLTGSSSWMLHLQGGGWCVDEADCVSRSKTDLGSSKTFVQTMDSILAHYDGGAHGLFSSDPSVNPDFYTYNKVYVRYCDGASYSGNVSTPVKVGKDTIYFRGHLNLKAIMNSLLSKGLATAKDLIVNGCSAGGLGVYLQLDNIRSIVPQSVSIKGVPECGFFMDLPNWDGKPSYTPHYQYVAKMQNVFGSLSPRCIAAHSGEEWKCFMAQYTMPFIETPFIIVNSLYDAWQMSNIIELPCANDISKCTKKEKAAFEELRTTMLSALQPAEHSKDNAVYTYSCQTHCGQFNHDDRWQALTVEGRVLRNAFTEWYLHGNSTVSLDCQGSKCNPTCGGTVDTVT